MAGCCSTNEELQKFYLGLPVAKKPTPRAPDGHPDLTGFYDNPFNTVGLIDPNLKHPYVQQYSFGIQHDFNGTVVEARYVGNHVVGAYRAFDFNQVDAAFRQRFP